MLGYLIYANGQSKIVLTDTSPQEMGTSYKPLIECTDEELRGIQVFQNDRAIDRWPNADIPFNQILIEAIALQLQITGFTKLKHIIEAGIYEDTNKLAIEFSHNRSPFIELELSQSRILCLTIIPRGQSDYIKEISDYDESWEIQKYVKNPMTLNRLIPNHTLPFATVNFDNVVLSVCECVDRQYNTELCSYLDTPDHVKANFIDPCLTIIKFLHSNNHKHGDLTDSNLTLSIKFNRVIFIDFKHISRLRHEAERLEDLRDVADTICKRSPPHFKNNPAIIYLYVLQDIITKVLGDFEKTNDPTVFHTYKKLTINTLISHVERFWCMTLPAEINDIDFSCYLEQKTLTATKQEAVIQGYFKACRLNDSCYARIKISCS